MVKRSWQGDGAHEVPRADSFGEGALACIAGAEVGGATARGGECLNGPWRASGIAWSPVEIVGIDEGIMAGSLTISHMV